jgi:hypothetical protein
MCCCVLHVQAHVINLRDAAAEGSKGLLHPLLKRYHVSSTTAEARNKSCDGRPLRCLLGWRASWFATCFQLCACVLWQRSEHVYQLLAGCM